MIHYESVSTSSFIVKMAPHTSTYFSSTTGLGGAAILAGFCLFAIFLVRGLLDPGSKLLQTLTALPRRAIAHLHRRYLAWRFLTSGHAIIQRGYDTQGAFGKPYQVLSPEARYIFLTNPEHLKEIDSAPDGTLSLYYASRQILQPKYTMYHFGWFDRPLEGQGFVRALRIHLTNRIPTMLKEMGDMVRVRWAKLQNELKADKNGVKRTPLSKTVFRTTVMIEAHAIFGKELASREEFLDQAVVYAEQLALCAEIIRVCPEWMAPLIGRGIGYFHTAQKFMYDSLMPFITRRFEEREVALCTGEPTPKHEDCMQWIMDSAMTKIQRTPDVVAHELMAIWFAALHPISITITYAIEDLCLHPEYIQPLRDEIRAGYVDYEATSEGLPLLDSFIKESTRLSPVESHSCRRRATAPFTLSDGTKLNPGDCAGAPMTSMMQDGRYYPSPQEFSGFRFAPPDVVASIGVDSDTHMAAPRQEKSSKWVEGDETWYMWGFGKNACPGKFYASALAKVILAHLIEEYDFELINPTASRWFTWRTARIPNESTKVVFTPRQK